MGKIKLYLVEVFFIFPINQVDKLGALHVLHIPWCRITLSLRGRMQHPEERLEIHHLFLCRSIRLVFLRSI